MLVSGGAEEGGSLRVAKVPLLLRISVRERNQSEEISIFALYQGDTFF